MKLSRPGVLYPDRRVKFDNLSQAISDKIEPSFADNEEERVRDRTANQTEMLAIIIRILVDRKLINTIELLSILGNEYTIEE